MTEAEEKAQRKKSTWRKKPATEKRKVAGRPKKAPAEKRVYTTNIAWSQGEISQVERWRAAAGYPQLATYIRTAILQQGPPPATAPDASLLKWVELARLASNLNQLATHANKGNILGPVDQRALINLLIDNRKELIALRNALLGLERE